MVVSQNRWFIMENPIKMDDDWGYPYFRKPRYLEIRVSVSHSNVDSVVEQPS